MEIKQDGKVFYAICAYEERLLLKENGFTFNNKTKRWETSRISDARKFSYNVFVEEDKNIIRDLDAIQLSMASKIDGVVVPSPDGLIFDDHQIVAIHYASMRKHTLCADPPGLGKTMVGVGLSNLMEARKVLVVPPAHLKINWSLEWAKWDTNNLSIGIIGGKQKTWPADKDVIICNYDMLAKFENEIREITWDLVIADEAHYLASRDSKRTRYFFGAKEKKKGKKIISPFIPPMKYNKCLFLTGTPIMSRPVELWPMVNASCSTTFGNNWTEFTTTYCSGFLNKYQARKPFWDVSGASNTEELQQKLRESFMIRRDKKTVLKDLPDKRRQLIILPNDGLIKLVEAEKTASQKVRDAILELTGDIKRKNDDIFSDNLITKFSNWGDSDYLKEFRNMSESDKIAFEELSTARKQLAEAKLPMAIEHIKNYVDANEKVIVFCVHTNVAEKLKEAFPSCAFITGSVLTGKRHKEVEKFQNDPLCNPMIANMVAGGTGYTMTAASIVVFVELDWTPAIIEQAEDRAWRRGQKNSVLCQHLVVDGSLDSKFVSILLEKQNITNKVLDM